MSGSEHARPVFVTPEQRRALGSLEDFLDPDGWIFYAVEAMRQAWDAAPVDPTEAVKAALAEHANGTADLLERLDLAEAEHYDVDEFDDEANLVLRALGCAKEPA